MTKAALVEKCTDLSEELERTRGSLSDTMDTNASLRHANTKLVRVKKKKKGVVDAKSKQFIRESFVRGVLANILALGVSIPASLSDGSFTPYLLLSGFTSAVLVPMQTYISKRNQEI